MDHLRLLGIGLQITRHAIREAHTDGNQHVALLLFQVGCVVSVHTQHTHIQRMCTGQCRKPQHRTSGRDIGLLEEAHQLLLGITQFHALSYQRHGFLRAVDQFCGLAHSVHVEFGIRHIRTDEVTLHGLPVDFLSLGVLGKVEHHRTRTACAGDIERTAHGPCHILGMTYLITPLRYRLRHTYEVHLLESIGTKRTDGHLPGYHHDGRRVEHGIGNARQRIGDSRATGYQGYAYLTTHAGIALGSVGSTLFVSHQDMVETLLLSSRIIVKRIVNGHDAATGVTEDGLHALRLQRPHQRLRSCNSIP